MKDADWDKAKDLFHEALRHPSEARAKWLSQVSGGNVRLKAQVEALLKAHSEAGGFLGEGKDEGPGEKVGPYKLLQQIGEGGFGTVYMAEQVEPVRRRVALKIIKLGINTKQVIARFEAERQALALMDHPNIARVLDAGATAEGRPYFVMELVKGVPITEYCDKGNLGPEQRIDLFIAVCGAVQHAHQKGIIHRDLKPSNILVTVHDGRAMPKVIDFGIAKAVDHRLTEKTLFTELHQIIGTPEYMSPEQAELSGLDIDTRADVYSLGVLLYELLTGTKPFDARTLLEKGFDEILRVIREVDPPKPSTRISTLGDGLLGVAQRRGTNPRLLGRFVRGDLDWIAMKALEKDRNRRYESASALAADLGRFLTDEPVLASPPGRVYRMRKFVRRHRIGVAAAVAVLVALALGLGVAALGWAEARAREREARIEAARAGTVVGFVENMLGAADPHYAKGVGFTVRELLDEVSQGVRGQLVTEPEVEASVQALLGNAYRGLGLPERARPHLARALELRREASSPRLTASRCDWAWQLHDLGHHDEATAELLRLREEGDPVFLFAILCGLADSLRHLRRLDEALRYAQEATAVARERYGPRSAEVAQGLGMVASVVRDRGDLDEAGKLYGEALAIRQALGSAQAATLLNNLGTIHEAQGRYAEAEASFREALAIGQALRGKEEPSTLANLAQVLRGTGRLAEAEETGRRALHIARATLPEGHPALADYLTGLAHCLALLGRYEEATDLCREALAIARAKHAGDDPAIVSALLGLSESLSSLGRFAEALAPCREALEMSLRVFGEEDGMSITCLDTLAGILGQQARYREAADLSRRALALSRRLFGDAHPETASNLNQLGPLLARLGEFEEAERCQRECLSIRRKALGPGHPAVANALSNLGMMLSEAGRRDESEACFLESLAIARAALGNEHPDISNIFNNLGGLARERGDHAAAERWLREAVALGTRTLGGDHATVAEFRHNLASALLAAGNVADAETELRRSLSTLQSARGEFHPTTVRALILLSEVLLPTRPDEARKLLEASLAAWAGSPGGAESAMAIRGVALTLADLQLRAQRPAEAETLLRGLLEGRHGGGRDDKDEHTWLAGLGVSLLRQGKHVEAEPILRRSLDLRKKALPPGDWRTSNAMSLLGESLVAQGKLDEAEPLLVEGYDRMTPPAAVAFRKREALERVIRLYEARGDTAKAAAWRAKLE